MLCYKGPGDYDPDVLPRGKTTIPVNSPGNYDAKGASSSAPLHPWYGTPTVDVAVHQVVPDVRFFFTVWCSPLPHGDAVAASMALHTGGADGGDDDEITSSYV